MKYTASSIEQIEIFEMMIMVFGIRFYMQVLQFIN
jgi:hypothetical protein